MEAKCVAREDEHGVSAVPLRKWPTRDYVFMRSGADRRPPRAHVSKYEWVTSTAAEVSASTSGAAPAQLLSTMPLSTLAGQAVAMFVLSFAVGYLPLVFRKLQQGQSALRWQAQAVAEVAEF